MEDQIELNEVPRDLRTPITEIGAILNYLIEWGCDLHERCGEPKKDIGESFILKIFGDMMKDETTSGLEAKKQLIEDSDEHFASNSNEPFPGLLYIAFIACAYCVETIRANKENRLNDAWTYAIDAQYWAGLLKGHWIEKYEGGISAVARKAAHVRHAENREIAERLKEWFTENRDSFPSLDAAAQAAIKIEPVAFRTARKHIGDAAKELRAARKE